MSHRVVTKAFTIAMALAAERVVAADEGQGVTASEQGQTGQTVEATCVDAHVLAQKQRARLELVEARDSLTACAQEYCPGPVRQDCLAWHQEVTVSIPSFVVSATADGKEIPGAALFVDGALLDPGLDGSAIELNPGRHEVRVVADGFREVAVTLTARQGEKNRLVQLELRPIVAPKPQMGSPKPIQRASVRVAPTAKRLAVRHTDSHPWVWGSALVAAVAGGVAISSYLDARARFEDAESCRPFCGSDVTDPIRTRLTLATVAGAIGIGALGVAGGAWLLDASWADETPKSAGINLTLGRRF